MALPKKALIAITSHHAPFYADGSKTGLFYGEAAHPYYTFTKAGFEVDFVSELGTFGLDDHSVSTDFLSAEDIKEYEDKSSTISKAFANIKKAKDVKADDYSIFFASAGHATLFDYPTATTLQSLASKIYQNGGVVSAVCHGPAIFANLKDLDTGKYLVEGKKITAFTDVGEDLMGVSQIIKDNKLDTCEEIAKKVGATYVAPATPFESFTVTDGRVVTGPNPASAHATAEAALKAL
ncbi:hypothetical protein CANARDRAFT_204714 [[Candida] arabinofermentans NRRL YB-2248]|uniref:D-lactate dehydratase n=1 Tax=[Candida] arabinofermentans NRRL YB-2248 TaxID=983967 RepID=A0A1E4ST36_9ASCO|nr:hypothetical protein CANARDRAFT_204714 [[Candida] arabinofermentans NRRL YB-2248]